MCSQDRKFVSRAGEKLNAALEAFCLDVSGLVCGDFGCNVGGFTDCLLQRGAEKVYAIDTGYGELAWKLRKHERVVVMERTNALYCEVAEKVDLVTIDVAWTPQELVVPAALKWLKCGGRIISLLKPHYEYSKLEGKKPTSVLSEKQAREVFRRVCQRLEGKGCRIQAAMLSPLVGKGGNVEFLLLMEKVSNSL